MDREQENSRLGGLISHTQVRDCAYTHTHYCRWEEGTSSDHRVSGYDLSRCYSRNGNEGKRAEGGLKCQGRSWFSSPLSIRYGPFNILPGLLVSPLGLNGTLSMFFALCSSSDTQGFILGR